MSRQSLRNRIGSFLLLCNERKFDGDGKYWSAVDLWRSLTDHSVIDPHVTVEDFRQSLGKLSRIGSIGRTRWVGNFLYYFKKDFKLHPVGNLGTKCDINVAVCLGAYQDSNVSSEIEAATTPNNNSTAIDTTAATNTDANTTSLPPQQSVPGGYQLVDSEQLSRFVFWCFDHHKTCISPAQSKLVLESFTKQGFASEGVYCCVTCGDRYQFNTSPTVKTNVVTEGRKWSRQQYEMNVTIPASLKFAGVCVQQSVEIFGEAGIQSPTQRNLAQQFQKVSDGIVNETSKQILENKKKIIACIKSREGYNEEASVLEWSDSNGNKHKTTEVEVLMDGTGPTREYGNRSTGTQSGACLIEKTTQLPIAFAVARTGCMRCTRRMHEAIRQGEKNVSSFVGQHSGRCTANSLHGPAVAEEHMLEAMGRDLLVDKQGEYLGDDVALFVSVATSDGDSKGAKRLTKAQEKIIGEAANGKATTSNCVTHVGKNLNKSFYKMKENDSTYGGVGGLENGRISAIGWDIKMCLRELKAIS